jgi:hypothetical protein
VGSYVHIALTRDSLALEVPDSAQTAQLLLGAGGEQVATPVMTSRGDRNARVRAPDGMQLTRRGRETTLGDLVMP